MTRKGENGRERIDLGLEALLSDSQNKEELNGGKNNPEDSHRHESWTLGRAEAVDPGEYNALADGGQWVEIVKRAEATLAKGDDLSAKVWWVRGHLGAFSMPVAFLSAPLLSVVNSLDNRTIEPSIESIVKETGLLALSRLREVNDRGQYDALKAALERIGIHESKNPRERKRTGTSSFRAADFVNSAGGGAGNQTKEPVRSGSSPRVFLISGVLLVGVLFLGGVGYFYPNLFTSPLSTAREAFVPEPLLLEQVVSPPAPKDPGGRLGALFYSIDNQKEKTDSAEVVQPEATPEAVPQPTPVVKESRGVENTAQPKVKERVNTSGPREGAEFRERVERRRGEERGDSRMSREAPRAALPPDRGRVFSNERTYSVVEGTAVLSAPSFGGEEIGHLERGDRVLVEGKLGRWLRLRSRRGKGGYVLAEDVEEIPDEELKTSSR
jgi:hypothetical protein